jgi:3-hydroxybutyryl-CoA dehydrogenase
MTFLSSGNRSWIRLEGEEMAIEKVFVVGSGLMGGGIAQVCAQVGIQVFITDISQEILNKALKNISWSVGKFVEKGKLKESLETIMGRIRTGIDFAAAGQADLAIEAVFEKLELKQEIFKKLDEVCAPGALLASNTSAIPITELATVTKHPERVLGLHFFSPAPMMEVVEIVKGVKTSEQTMQAGVQFVQKIGKEPIRVESDVPGFLLNRINLIGYVEAIRLLEQGIGTVEDIDKGVRLAFGRRLGPLETGDLVGLDVSFGGLTAIYNESKDIRYYPPQLLRRKVKAGELGRKTGRGWYEYNPDGSPKKK